MNNTKMSVLFSESDNNADAWEEVCQNMKRKKCDYRKRIIMFFLAFTLVFAGIPSMKLYAVELAKDSEGNLVGNDEKEFYYKVPAGSEDSGECTLYVYGGNETDIVLPKTCGAYKVTTVGEDFSSMIEYLGNEKKSLTTVRIPFGYKVIEAEKKTNSEGKKVIIGAFQNQTELYRIEIPSSVTSIGKYAFEGCDKSKLTIVTPKGSYAEKYAKKYGYKYKTVSVKSNGKIMKVGTKKTVTVNNAFSKVTWKSSKPSVATINSKGKITAKKAGKTKITAIVNGEKYSFTLTVKK